MPGMMRDTGGGGFLRDHGGGAAPFAGTYSADTDTQVILGRWASNVTTADVARWVHYDDRDAAAAAAYGFSAETAGAVGVNHGTSGGADFSIRRGGSTTWKFAGNTAAFQPENDNAVSFGATGTRVANVYSVLLHGAPGGTSTNAPAPLVLSVNSTSVATVGTGEDDLMTYTLPAAAMEATNRAVRITAWGTTANNANVKTLKMKFGATNIMTNALTQSVAGAWCVQGIVIRTGAATQISLAKLEENAVANSDVETGTPAETLSGAVVIKCTGEATDNNDIVQLGMIVEYLN